ncbi:MAG: hypothetical protein J2P53_04210 [Bradyrhizobiaceae bacterium]|nr:hypothetical protein [Bradyrhizobiaceae bacterium]
MYYRVMIMCCFIAVLLIDLTGCTVVDRFGSRVYDDNLTSQEVMNKEILVNIIRASRYQPLNFMAITQVTGGQSETLTTGLPTITLGPAQTVAQHQFPITNSVASGATGTFQTNPLVSSRFQQGMMSPVSPKILAYLLASHDRETVFNVVIDSINVTSGNTTVRYVNDPANDQGLPGGCSAQSASRALADPNGGHRFLLNEDVCNYSKFINFATEGMQYGVSAELVPVPRSLMARRGAGNQGGPNAANLPGGDMNATAVPEATGRLCWDPGLAIPQRKAGARGLKPLCGKNLVDQNTNEDFSFQILGTLRFELRFRSPAGIFAALGKQIRDGSAERVRSLLPPSQRVFDGEPLLTIKTDGTTDSCAVLAQYDGQTYCVPQGADRTAMVFNILQELKNLSTTPSDLNSAFSVRVVN